VKPHPVQINSTTAVNKGHINPETGADSQFAEKWARSAKQKGVLK